MARTIIEISCLSDTNTLGQKLASKLQPKDIFAFYGNVGAGKTTLIKSMVSSLHFPIKEVTSPTFTYLNIYNADLPIYHFDLYRFNEEVEFLQKGFDEYFDLDGVCLIEWAEKIPSILPKRAKKIFLQYDSKARSCTIE